MEKILLNSIHSSMLIFKIDKCYTLYFLIFKFGRVPYFFSLSFFLLKKYDVFLFFLFLFFIVTRQVAQASIFNLVFFGALPLQNYRFIYCFDLCSRINTRELQVNIAALKKCLCQCILCCRSTEWKYSQTVKNIIKRANRCWYPLF